MKKRHFLYVIAVAFTVFFQPITAIAVYNCAGITDDCPCGVYNPFPCCSVGGNCTWWAWHMICCNWGEEAAKEIAYDWQLPRNAENWNDNGRAKDSSIFSISNIPAPGTVAVREAHSDNGNFGHVAWVKSVNGNEVTVTEMMWCVNFSGGYRTKTYNKSHFDGGFIYYNPN